MKMTQMDMECTRCGGLLLYTENENKEEVEACTCCGLLKGIRLNKENVYERFDHTGVGYYRLTSKEKNVETNTISKEELDECIKKFKEIITDERIDTAESYLSIYDEKTGKYKVIIGELDSYSEAILKQWEHIDTL